MIDFHQLFEQFKGWGLLVGAAIFGAMRLRKKLSSDNVDIGIDHERRAFVGDMAAEYKAMRKENHVLRDDLSTQRAKVSRLEAELGACRADYSRVSGELTELRAEFDRFRMGKP
jgi:hypothetical protein